MQITGMLHGAKLLRFAGFATAEVLGADAEHRTLPGQTHMYKSSVMAPELVEFFSRAQRTAGPIE